MTPPGRRPGLIRAVLSAAAFAVNVDVTIVNVTLPSLLVRDLDASTRQLQWIVDAYTLTFAALVLAAGALGAASARHYVNVIVAGKQPALTYLSMDEAVAHRTRGLGIWPWAGQRRRRARRRPRLRR